MKKFIGLISFFVAIILCGISVLLLKNFNPILFKNLLSKINPATQIDFQTKASITDIKEQRKLVTAKRQLDFINVMDGKDGSLIEIYTYEVKAGLDFSNPENPEIKVFDEDTNIINTVALRTPKKNSSSEIINYIKPVQSAYKQKAKEYSIENNILQKAKGLAEKTLKNLVNQEVKFRIADNSEIIEFPYIPINLKVDKDFFDKNFDITQNYETNGFLRDSIIFEHKGSSKKWRVRIGDSGMKYYETFEKFYQNILDTNTKENLDSPKDKVQLYRFFDPQYPEESISLSYASDYFRTFFLLNQGRIYYIDSFMDDETNLDDNTVITEIAPLMLYLASSIHPSVEEKEYQNEYEAYVKQFLATENSIKNEDNQYTFNNNVEKLLRLNILYDETGEGQNHSLQEKLFIARNNIKQNLVSCLETSDSYMDDLSSLLTRLRFEKDFSDEQKRRTLLDDITSIDSRLKTKDLLQSYYFAWLLQTQKLLVEENKNYTEALLSNNTLVFRPGLIDLDDNERNDYFYKLFSNRIFNSRRFVDTVLKPKDILYYEDYGTNKFVFLNFDSDLDRPDVSTIYGNMKKLNGDKDFSGKFVLVYRQNEFDLGIDFIDTSIHAMVFDEATFRLFPDVKASSLKALRNASVKLFKTSYPPYCYYGDYNNFRLGKNGLTINGQALGTKKLTKKGKQQYRRSNDYAEISEVLKILTDIQRAYYQDDKDYYLDVMKDTLEDEINHYVFDYNFRPSPRLILDTQTDAQKRYNN